MASFSGQGGAVLGLSAGQLERLAFIFGSSARFAAAL